MTDDPTRRIPWHDDAEAAATQASRHTYPRSERLVEEVVRSAARLRRWARWAGTVVAVAVVVGLLLAAGGPW